MGQAKARGSFESRKALAVEREAVQAAERHKQAEEQRRADEALAAIARSAPGRKYSPLGISSRNRATLMVAAALSMSAALSVSAQSTTPSTMAFKGRRPPKSQ